MGKKRKRNKLSKGAETLYPTRDNNKCSRFLDPSVLAQHAALARRQSHSLSSSSSSSSSKKSLISTQSTPSHISKSKNATTPKTETYQTKNEIKTNAKKRKHKKDGISVFSSAATKAQELKKDEKTNKDQLLYFGNPKWRNIEQLCHFVFFHHFTPHDISTYHISQRSSAVIVVVFMSDLEQMKEYSSLFKPIVHPSLSIAFHKKVSYSDHFENIYLYKYYHGKTFDYKNPSYITDT